MRLEILDGEILLDGRVVSRVVAGLPYTAESELTAVIDEYLDEDAREELVREARDDMGAEIACGVKEAIDELAKARALYAQFKGNRP
jgi:hypothetical protein